MYAVRKVWKSFGWAVLTCMMALCAGNVSANDWRFPLGLTGITGLGDVVDLHEDNLEAQGYDIESPFYWPVGLSFQPYLETDSGFRVGGGIGPFAFMWIESIDSDQEDINFYDVPVNLNIGYTFMADSSISPYVKGGIMYHFAGGDYVEDVQPGFHGGVGVEFFRKQMVGLGLEISYDTSKIEFEKISRVNGVLRSETEDIEPYKLMISIFAVF